VLLIFALFITDKFNTAISPKRVRTNGWDRLASFWNPSKF